MVLFFIKALLIINDHLLSSSDLKGLPTNKEFSFNLFL